MLVQAFARKGCSFASQIVLALLLLPEDFGLVGLALSVAAFTSLIQRAGIREVLIHRHRHFARWATPAFWMSLTAGLLAGGALAIVSPIAARIYNEPRLVGLLLVVAMTSPIIAATTVSHAKLQAELRFGFLARMGIFEAIAQAAMTITLAFMGFGPYSFVLPRPIIALIRLIVEWSAARPPVRCKLQWRRWKFLIGDTLIMFLGSMFIIITHQGDYIVLGILFTAEVVGIYYFAFNLSMQAVTTLTMRLTDILFPALSRIADPVRQTRAYVKACSLLALIATPLAFLQAAIADPAIRLIFAERWHDSIPLFQILSIATAFRIVLGSGGSLLQAQGRFRQRAILFGCYAPIFITAVYVGGATGGVVGVAISVSTYYAALGMFHLWLLIRPGGGRWLDATRVFAGPMGVSAFAIGTAWAVGSWLDGAEVHPILVIAATIAVGMTLYAFGAMVFMRERSKELLDRLLSLRSSRKPSKTPT